MVAPIEITALITKFEGDSEYFHSDAYKEMALRSEFLNPVLRALGWDPDNPGLPAADREVTQEDSIFIDGGDKAPDYAFSISRRRQFFLEAKRPSVSIATGRDPAYQIRRYCWNAGLPLGIVTDFEEWAVYDCRYEPKPNDAANVGRIEFFRYDQLAEQWEELVELFGRDQVQAGSLANFAAEKPSPRGTLTIDQAFLKEISQWRSALAVDIAKSNPSLDSVHLNTTVQTFIDRLVFLRIAEARGLEAFGELQNAANSDSLGVYQRLMSLFKRADNRYNSGLFHFSSVKGQLGPPDSVAPTLKIADPTLRTIIGRLYYPHPYEFSAMPADILGRVYEQFLGSTITLKGRKADVEVKPEVRKAGGVYYTPVPIVDYLVEMTLGPLLEGSTPKDVAKLRVLDPACGSGSFLIAAYQYLMDWHVTCYSASKKNSKKFLEAGSGGTPRLNTAERKRILLANIFGVDIDRQAVEVTKLSLLLKVIEGQQQLELQVGRLLPDLDANVRCGNSLIDVDFQMPLIATEEERLSYNPFNWDGEFPLIMAAGGFDAIIGNPPYLSIDATWGRKDPRLDYIKGRYSDIHTDKTDILFYFLARAVELCKGEIGFIVSRSFLEADKAQKLRGWIARSARVREVLDFREATVFPRVGINTAIVRISGSKAVKQSSFRRLKSKSLPPGYGVSYLRDPANFESNTTLFSNLDSKAWVFTDQTSAALLAKIDSAGDPVGDILHIGQGMQTGNNSAFQLPATKNALAAALMKEGLAFRRARNSDIQPFAIRSDGPVVLYLEDARSFTSLPPEIKAQLNQFKDALKARKAFERGDCDWWRFTWPLHKEYVESPRILVPYRATSNRFAVDQEADYLGLTDTTVLYENDQQEDLHYLVAILNSRVLTYRFRFIGKLVGGGSYEYFHNTVSKLPIPRRNPGDSDHDQLVAIARTVSNEKEMLRSTLVPAERSAAEKRIRFALEQAEDLVCTLFGLTDDERAIIDSALAEEAGS